MMPRPFSEMDSILPRPAGYDGKHNGEVSAKDLTTLDDRTVVEAWKVPWENNGHLSDATDDIIDAAWGIQDGRRNLRQMKNIPEMKSNGKK